MTAQQREPRLPKQIFWNDVKPEDFINAQEMDWIEGIGEISTYYELKFVRRFGETIRSRPHTPAPAESISKELALELCMDARKEAARAATLATLDYIQDHNDGRLKGMEILFSTPSGQRTESALVKHFIESLRQRTTAGEQQQKEEEHCD
jgi:hypothetical protein